MSTILRVYFPPSRVLYVQIEFLRSHGFLKWFLLMLRVSRFLAFIVYIHLYIHIYMFYLSDHLLTYLLSYPNSRDAIASKKCGNNQPLIGLIYWRQIADLDRKLTLNYSWKGHINKSYQVCWPCVRWMNQILKYYVFTYFTINSLNGRQNEIIKNVEVAGFRLNNTY